jgi:asparagine synthase (glutamine-hydrolysing)
LSYYDKTEPHGDDYIYFGKIEAHRGRSGHHVDVSRLANAPASLESTQFKPIPGYFGSGRNLEVERAEIVRGGGYRVTLSGMGGDEFLGGIPNPSALLADLIVRGRPIKLAKQLAAWSLIKRRPWTHLLWEAVLELFPPSVGQYLSHLAKIEPWINRDFAKRTRFAVRLIDVDEHFGLWLPTRRSLAAGALLMANKLAKWSPPAMQYEEVRFPYLDQNLIEFVLSIPASQLLRPGDRRSLMRRALAGLVPEDILGRRTKQFGARTPLAGLEKNVERLQLVFSSPLSSGLGYVERKCFLDALKAATNGAGVHISRLLRTISLEFWLRDLFSRNLIRGLTATSAPLGELPPKVSS